MKSKIIVTGGTGFIGSHTVVELQQAGYETVVIDDLRNSDETVLDNIEKITGVKPLFEKVDLTDHQAAANIIAKHKDAAACIHFAALKAVGESVADPLLYYRNNLFTLINLLDNFRDSGLEAFIFSSSATVYGQPDILPITEDSPVVPANSPYGNTKQIAEEIINETVGSGAIKAAISLRYFNPIGAHESALIGELPKGVPNNLMPFITQTAAGAREELKVFGQDYKTPDGTAVRDYIHVVDVAKAHVSAVRRILEKKNKEAYEVFNLGTGKGFSVLDVIKSFEKTSGQSLNYSFAKRRAGDVEQIYADTSRANRELGWKADLDLDAMTASAWEWEKKIRRG